MTRAILILLFLRYVFTQNICCLDSYSYTPCVCQNGYHCEYYKNTCLQCPECLMDVWLILLVTAFAVAGVTLVIVLILCWRKHQKQSLGIFNSESNSNTQPLIIKEEIKENKTVENEQINFKDSPEISNNGKKIYIGASIICLVGIVLVIIAIAVNDGVFTLSQYTLPHEIIFILFGFLCVIYTFFCIKKGKALNELYTAFALIALAGSGAICHNSVLVLDYCIYFVYTSCNSDRLNFAGAFIFAISTIILNAYKDRTRTAYQPKSIEKFNRILILLSVIAIIGVVIVLGVTIITKAENKFLYLCILFIIFGLLVGIYGIVCGIKKKLINFLYSIFLSIAISMCGPIIFFSGYYTSFCIKYDYDCGSDYATLFGSFIFMICALLVVASKHFLYQKTP